MLVECTCLHCGKVFLKQSWLVNRGENKYCSHKCSTQSRITKVERTCKICGQVFLIIPSEIKKGNGKYCGKTCMYEGTSISNAKYTIEQFAMLRTEFTNTGNVKKAATAAGINHNYAKKILFKNINMRVTSENKIEVISRNTVRKFASSVNQTDMMNEFVKRMPLNLTEQQAKLYAMGYADAKAWDKGTLTNLTRLIHRVYKIQKRVD